MTLLISVLLSIFLNFSPPHRVTYFISYSYYEGFGSISVNTEIEIKDWKSLEKIRLFIEKEGEKENIGHIVIINVQKFPIQ